jgi:hypothetical protein
MNNTDTKKPRGNRRRDAVVERDKVLAAEKTINENKTQAEIAADLGVSERTARRLASAGLREVMESQERPKLEDLFRNIVTGFTEVLEDIQETIVAYRTAKREIPSRVLMSKIAALAAVAKACGFGSDILLKDVNPASSGIQITITSDVREVPDYTEFKNDQQRQTRFALPEPKPALEAENRPSTLPQERQIEIPKGTGSPEAAPVEVIPPPRRLPKLIPISECKPDASELRARKQRELHNRNVRDNGGVVTLHEPTPETGIEDLR